MSTPDTPETLPARLRALLEAAKPHMGPPAIYIPGVNYSWQIITPNRQVGEYIAEGVNALPSLLDAIDAAEAAIARLATEPPLWRVAITEANEAHLALDRLGAPTAKRIVGRDAKTQQDVTVGLSERIASLGDTIRELRANAALLENVLAAPTEDAT